MIQHLYFIYNLIILIFSIKIFCCWRENEMNYKKKKKKKLQTISLNFGVLGWSVPKDKATESLIPRV